MRLRKLQATGVHGYLNLEICFQDDLTFLVGPNGSGKTSALQLLMGLLTPAIEILWRTKFERTSVTIETDEQAQTVITACRTSGGVTLTIDGVEDELTVETARLRSVQYPDARRRDREELAFIVSEHPVGKAIKDLATPVFLGLDRRGMGTDSPWDDDADRLAAKRRRGSAPEHLDREIYSSSMAALVEVSHLIGNNSDELRAKKSDLDEQLRRNLVLRAFSHDEPPRRDANAIDHHSSLTSLKQTLARFEEMTAGLGLHEIDGAVKSFLDRAQAAQDEFVSSMESYDREDVQLEEQRATALRWYVLQEQIPRIQGSVRLLKEYEQSVKLLFQKEEQFLSLVNMFLVQSGKKLRVDQQGTVKVQVGDTTRPLSALSSGERQVVVMLAHLSLNRRLSSSSVFIVDEPELSLHISWQEKFVDSVRAANPEIQVILATHSPAIILDRGDNCESIRSVESAV